jgi:hypothetical protein
VMYHGVVNPDNGGEACVKSGQEGFCRGEHNDFFAPQMEQQSTCERMRSEENMLLINYITKLNQITRT